MQCKFEDNTQKCSLFAVQESWMLGKRDGQSTDRWAGHKNQTLLPIFVTVLVSKHPQLPNPPIPIDLKVLLSHFTAFTHDVNTNKPTKPQAPSPPAQFWQPLPFAVTSSIIFHSSYQTKKRKETKPKETRQSAAPAPQKPQAESWPGQRQAKGFKNDLT